MERTVKFIPIKQGTKVDLGDIGIFGVSGNHKILGFTPGRRNRREGWIVVLVDHNSRGLKPKLVASIA